MSARSVTVLGKEKGKERGKEIGKESVQNKCEESGFKYLYDLDLDRMLAKKVPGRISLVRVAARAEAGSCPEDLDSPSGSQGVAEVLARCLKIHGPLRWRGCSPDAPQKLEEFLASLGPLQVRDIQGDGLLGWFREVAGEPGSKERLQALNHLMLLQETLAKALKRGHPFDARLLTAIDQLGREYGIVGRSILNLTMSMTELKELAAQQLRADEQGGSVDPAEA